jgi:hypothetical protein
MPIIPVKIDDVEALDYKLEKMCQEESAILISDGGVFSNIFPRAMDRSRLFKKKYGVALRPGRLLFAKLAEISLFFNHRDKCGTVQVRVENIDALESALPEIKQLLIKSISLGSYEKMRAAQGRKKIRS